MIDWEWIERPRRRPKASKIADQRDRAVTVKCPTCAAHIGRMCVTGARRYAAQPHIDRFRLAVESNLPLLPESSEYLRCLR